MSCSKVKGKVCNFYSELKSTTPIKFTWKIGQLKTFLRRLPSIINDEVDQISCRFQGDLYETVRDTWTLGFQNRNGKPHLILQGVTERSDRIYVCAEVVLLNSQKGHVFSKKSELKYMAPKDEIIFDLGMTWAQFIDQMTDGDFTVHCTLEQKMWNNGSTSTQISSQQLTDEDRIQHDSLATDFKCLLESGDATDVSLKLRNGNLLRAHKAVLCARSPVLLRMFLMEMKEAEDNMVEIDDIGEGAMKVLLSYIYTGKLEVPEKQAEIFKELVYAADKYQLTKLKDLCDEHLPEYCNAGNAFDLLQLSRLHHLKAAEKFICSFIKMNISTILESPPEVQLPKNGDTDDEDMGFDLLY